MANDSLAVAVDALPAPWHGHYFAVVDSTQDEARAASQRGAPDRSLFVADYQRAGRGRHGRAWLAPPGRALLMSILFRETARGARPWRFTSLASLALVAAIDELLPEIAPTIK
jgi:BirA family transcriptional regulator, biotin operon repressor / biotin---[acetyl-CoA-carboxylase] ligase